MSTPPPTPRAAAKRRQEAKATMVAAIQHAIVGQRLSFSWRVVALNHATDDGWCTWTGTIADVLRNDDDMVSSLLVKYDLACPELEEETQNFPPTPSLEDPTDRFEVKDVRLVGARRGLAQKRERQDDTARPAQPAGQQLAQRISSIRDDGRQPPTPPAASSFSPAAWQHLAALLGQPLPTSPQEQHRVEREEDPEFAAFKRWRGESSTVPPPPAMAPIAPPTPTSGLLQSHFLQHDAVTSALREAVSGKSTWLLPGILQVPSNIPESQRFFYAHIWVLRAVEQPSNVQLIFNEWSSGISELCARYKIHPVSSIMMSLLKGAVKDYLVMLASGQNPGAPSTLPAWRHGFFLFWMVMIQVMCSTHGVASIKPVYDRLSGLTTDFDLKPVLKDIKRSL